MFDPGEELGVVLIKTVRPTFQQGDVPGGGRSERVWAESDAPSARRRITLGFSALGTGDVNTVCSLEWVDRRHLLAVRALNEQSLLFKGIFEGKHINPWELENLISFLRRPQDTGTTARGACGYSARRL